MVGLWPGLILAEAKAHYGELGSGGGVAKNHQNEKRIRDAIAEANHNLNRISYGWNLTADSHYQLCNRFAWGWKVASLGVPVILVYLGFLNVEDMPGYRVFRTDEEWAMRQGKGSFGGVACSPEGRNRPSDAAGNTVDRLNPC